jgi:hypothetical protein
MVHRLVLALGLCLALLAGVAGAGGVTGDADCSSAIDARDSLAILQADVGLLPVSALCADNADVNGDGRINPIDAVLILQYTAHIIDHL